MPSDILALIILLLVLFLLATAFAVFVVLVAATIMHFAFRRKPTNDLDVSFREQWAVCKVNHAPHRKNLYMLDVPYMMDLQRVSQEVKKGLMKLNVTIEKCQENTQKL